MILKFKNQIITYFYINTLDKILISLMLELHHPARVGLIVLMAYSVHISLNNYIDINTKNWRINCKASCALQSCTNSKLAIHYIIIPCFTTPCIWSIIMFELVSSRIIFIVHICNIFVLVHHMDRTGVASPHPVTRLTQSEYNILVLRNVV